MRRSILVLIAWTLVAATATAGTLSPPLAERLADLAPTDEITVLVVLRDRVDVQAMARDLHQAKSTNDDQHRRVISALQAKAEATQGDLLTALGAKSGAGGVRSYRAYWLLNAVRMTATTATVREIADRADVDVVEPDLVVELVDTIKEPVFLDKNATGVGTAPGVVAIGARRVWYELGVDGTGALVANLDTGVDSNHPALSHNWRGATEPIDECWLDLSGNDVSQPFDTQGHGTHVMGTIVGVAPGDTVGVAPGARWITSNPNTTSDFAEFDADILTSFQFMADPDGDPATTDDVPDVVQNSWGVLGSFPGYEDCDSRWWEALDAVEAAGVVMVFAAGNEGPGERSLLLPADRATDLYNAFSVGSLNAANTISDFSSRGPSRCGGLYAVKPEITAPGEDVYSCWPGNRYVAIDGTSMAGPHVAGVAALMRSANPDLDVIDIKEILLATAHDLGVPGDDNTYGHGSLDAYAAVLRALGGYGLVHGTLRDAATGEPLAGAEILAFGTAGTASRLTDAGGRFFLSLPTGEQQLGISLFGYDAESFSIQVPEQATLTLERNLDATPRVTIAGTVTAAGGAPLPGARLDVPGTSLPTTLTATDGGYALEVPVAGHYTLRARADGYFEQTATLQPTAPETHDFQLAMLTDEGFESGDFQAYPWRHDGDAPWRIDATLAHEGAFSARSGEIIGGQSSVLSVELSVETGDLVFWYRVRSEAGDRLRFAIDGVERASWSGRVDWSRAGFLLTAGDHVLTWTYEKDSFIDAYEDAVWIDVVERPRPARVQWTPDAIEADVASGEATTIPITLSSSGAVDLRYTATVELQSPAPAAAPPPLAGAKGAAPPRKGTPTTTSAGGPDVFGYRWIDSDDPAGPPYVWEDISGNGEALPFGDDTILTLPLPFTFSFYGREFEEVTVCSNGWLNFTTPYIHANNFPIPSDLIPNGLVCPYWTDLDPTAAGTIYALSDPEQGRLIVQWDGVFVWNTHRPQTFQVQLLADGRILCYYESLTLTELSTVGLENHAGTGGLQVVYNAPYLHDGLALQFRPTTPWLAVAPQQGDVPPGGSGAVEVIFDARDTEPGFYQGRVLIGTNDPDHIEVVVPVSLTVSDDVGNEAGDEAAPPPAAIALHAAYPNPFNPTTSITYDLPRPGRCRLAIYDLGGRLVRELVAGAMPAGRHQTIWNGTDHDGRRVASGTYFYRLSADDFVRTRSLVLVK